MENIFKSSGRNDVDLERPGPGYETLKSGNAVANHQFNIMNDSLARDNETEMDDMSKIGWNDQSSPNKLFT